jgi:hypothetical protein
MEYNKIEIELPVGTDISNTFVDRLVSLLTEDLCEEITKKNPGLSAWISGIGAKPSYSRIDAALLGKTTYSPLIKDGDEPVYDDSILHIEISVR